MPFSWIDGGTVAIRKGAAKVVDVRRAVDKHYRWSPMSRQDSTKQKLCMPFWGDWTHNKAAAEILFVALLLNTMTHLTSMFHNMGDLFVGSEGEGQCVLCQYTDVLCAHEVRDCSFAHLCSAWCTKSGKGVYQLCCNNTDNNNNPCAVAVAANIHNCRWHC